VNESGPKRSDWAAKNAAIDAAAKAIIDQETAARDAKTARLRALREARLAAACNDEALKRNAPRSPRSRSR